MSMTKASHRETIHDFDEPAGRIVRHVAADRAEAPRGRMGSVNYSGSIVPVLNWLLEGHVPGVFAALYDDHHGELEQFALWFLREARAHAHFYRGHPMGRGLHSFWARLGPEVQGATDRLGLSVPDEVRLPPIPLAQP